ASQRGTGWSTRAHTRPRSPRTRGMCPRTTKDWRASSTRTGPIGKPRPREAGRNSQDKEVHFMRPIKSLSLAALLSALLVSPAFAGPGGGPGGPGGPGGGPGMEGRLEKELGKLGLSDSQPQPLHAILTAPQPHHHH